MKIWGKDKKQLWNNQEVKKDDACECAPCGCDEVSGDNVCGCSHEARDSVRLTDAEIAEDVIASLNSLCGDYADCIASGCDCEDALCSCERVRKSLCDYVKTYHE